MLKELTQILLVHLNFCQSGEVLWIEGTLVDVYH